MEYSLDMLRLQTYISSDLFMSFANSYLSVNPAVEYFESYKAVAYRHLYSVKEKGFELSPFGYDMAATYENNFMLSYRHNTEKPTKIKFALVIEFNPNKCNIREGLLNLILSNFFSNVYKIDVKSCDFAIDFKGFNINNVIWDREFKRKEVIYKGSSGKSIYLGERSSDGSTKIYDKGAEQRVSYDWVRYEMTSKFDCLSFSDCYNFDSINISSKPPKAYFVSNVDCINDIKMKCCVMCLLRGDFILSDFPKYLRKKIELIISDYSVYVVDECCINQFKRVLKDFFDFYINVIPSTFKKPVIAPQMVKIGAIDNSDSIHQITFSDLPTIRKMAVFCDNI